MTMFLVLCGISVVLTAMTAVLLSVLFRVGDASNQEAPGLAPGVDAPKFFARGVPASVPIVRPAVPLELLRVQIEQHVRMEQAAAETFHQYPTVEALHRQTASPLMH